MVEISIWKSSNGSFDREAADDGTDKLGKKTGGDLGEGKMTLPAIYLLRDGSEAACEQLLRCFGKSDNSEQDLRAVVTAMETSGALDAARADARVYSDRAAASLEALPDSRAKRALAELPEFVLARHRNIWSCIFLKMI